MPVAFRRREQREAVAVPILKQGDYDRTISVEASNFDEPLIRHRGEKILEFLRTQWQEA